MDENHQEQAPAPKSSSNSMMIIVAIIVLVVVGGGGFFAYKHFKHSSSAPTQVMSEQVTPTTAAMKMEATSSPSATEAYAGAVTVTGSNFAFAPKEIHAKKGQKVTITFKNSEGFHNLIIDEFSVKTATIKAGETATVSFTPDKTGTFQYYCSVGSHRQMGMWGNLIVE